MSLRGRHCRGGPPWPPLRAWRLSALCWLIVGLSSVSAQQQPVQIHGTVTDPNNNAIQHAAVEFESDGKTTRTTTDLSGDFTVLSARPYGTLSISSPGFSNAKIKVTTANDSLSITLYPAVINERIVVSAPNNDERVPVTSVSQFNLGPHQIATSGAVTIDDVLRQVPGFSLFRRSGGLTTNPTAQGVSLRGVGANGASRALVMYDGVPLNSPFGGWVYWNRVPRVSVESAEVLNGATSDLYGSGALGGVINIRTATQPATFFDLEASGGNESTGAVSLNAGKAWGGFGVELGLQALRTGGYVLVPPDQRGRVDTPAATSDLSGVLTLSAKRGFIRLGSFGESRNNGTPLQINDTRITSLDLGLDVSSM